MAKQLLDAGGRPIARRARQVVVQEAHLQLAQQLRQNVTGVVEIDQPAIAALFAERDARLMDCACQLAGPGRGDCENAVGLPGLTIPGQHDGEDETVDVYGKPNGWCWYCWQAWQINVLQQQVGDMVASIRRLLPFVEAQIASTSMADGHGCADRLAYDDALELVGGELTETEVGS